MPGGKMAAREVVEHFGAVAVLAMDDSGRIPMIYQYRHPLGRRLWELPAGLLDVNGEAPHLTAARELKEEAGLQAENWQVLIDLDTTPGFSDESVRVYLATDLTQVDQPDAHDEEADMTLDWIPIAEALAQVFSGEIVDSLAIAGILAAYVVTQGVAQPRPVDAAWTDKPVTFAGRRADR